MKKVFLDLFPTQIVLFVALALLIGLTGCNGTVEEEETGHWVIVGNAGLVKVSYDGGLNWTQGNMGHTQYIDCLTTDTRGMWVAAMGYWDKEIRYYEFYSSTDGGMNWSPVGFNMANLDIEDACSDIYGIYVIAVGYWVNGLATIHYSTNGGLSWTHFSDLNHYPSLRAIDTDDQGYWVAAGAESTILYTGQPTSFWNEPTILRSYEEHGSFLDMAYVGNRTVDNTDQSIWLVVGGHTDTTQGILFKSMDRGHTWNWMNLGYIPGGQFFRAAASDDNGSCIIAGDNGMMYLSTDFADSWTQVPLGDWGISEMVTAVGTDKNGRWIATLASRRIIYTTDLITWTLIGPISPVAAINEIDFGI